MGIDNTELLAASEEEVISEVRSTLLLPCQPALSSFQAKVV